MEILSGMRNTHKTHYKGKGGVSLVASSNEKSQRCFFLCMKPYGPHNANNRKTELETRVFKTAKKW